MHPPGAVLFYPSPLMGEGAPKGRVRVPPRLE